MSQFIIHVNFKNMSGSYEIGNGGGEVNYFEESHLSKDPSHLANVIAGEIVNEILESALDIATKASETGIHWREIKDADSRASVPKMEVGDIVEQIDAQSNPRIADILQGLNAISVNEEGVREITDPLPLDTEMRKLLVEMLSPPYEIVNYSDFAAKSGVGDQPYDTQIPTNIHPEDEEEDVPRAVEKKTRVTDLIKNFPQIISEYLLKDDISKHNQEEWEESEEELLQVIELECVKPGEELYRVQKKFVPEEVALPEDEDDLLITPPNEEVLENPFKEEELQLIASDSDNSTGAKGDDPRGVIEESTLKEVALIDGDRDGVRQKTKKKKWNFGTRLWGFFRKGHKSPQERGSSTSTQKPL